MRHVLARQAIDEISRGTQIDRRALILTFAGLAADHDIIADDLPGLLMEQAATLPVETVDMALPADLASKNLGSFIRRGIEAICRNARQAAFQITALWAVTELWPHATREERDSLQLAWYRLHRSVRAKTGSWVPADTLREWSRNLPTLAGAGDSSKLGALTGLLEERADEQVYQQLCNYLGNDLNLPRLFAMIGAVANRALLHRFDQRCTGQLACIATVAGARLAEHGKPEDMVTLVIQLTHEIWWHHHHDSRELDPGNRDPDISLDDAVKAGDYRAAQRAARKLADQPQVLWQRCFAGLRSHATADNLHWPRLLYSVTIARARSGGRDLSPDEAALLGGALAGVSWLSQSQQPV